MARNMFAALPRPLRAALISFAAAAPHLAALLLAAAAALLGVFATSRRLIEADVASMACVEQTDSEATSEDAASNRLSCVELCESSPSVSDCSSSDGEVERVPVQRKRYRHTRPAAVIELVFGGPLKDMHSCSVSAYSDAHSSGRDEPALDVDSDSDDTESFVSPEEESTLTREDVPLYNDDVTVDEIELPAIESTQAASVVGNSMCSIDAVTQSCIGEEGDICVTVVLEFLEDLIASVVSASTMENLEGSKQSLPTTSIGFVEPRMVENEIAENYKATDLVCEDYKIVASLPTELRTHDADEEDRERNEFEVMGRTDQPQLQPNAPEEFDILELVDVADQEEDLDEISLLDQAHELQVPHDYEKTVEMSDKTKEEATINTPKEIFEQATTPMNDELEDHENMLSGTVDLEMTLSHDVHDTLEKPTPIEQKDTIVAPVETGVHADDAEIESSTLTSVHMSFYDDDAELDDFGQCSTEAEVKDESQDTCTSFDTCDGIAHKDTSQEDSVDLIQASNARKQRGTPAALTNPDHKCDLAATSANGPVIPEHVHESVLAHKSDEQVAYKPCVMSGVNASRTPSALISNMVLVSTIATPDAPSAELSHDKIQAPGRFDDAPTAEHSFDSMRVAAVAPTSAYHVKDAQRTVLAPPAAPVLPSMKLDEFLGDDEYESHTRLAVTAVLDDIEVDAHAMTAVLDNIEVETRNEDRAATPLGAHIPTSTHMDETLSLAGDTDNEEPISAEPKAMRLLLDIGRFERDMSFRASTAVKSSTHEEEDDEDDDWDAVHVRTIALSNRSSSSTSQQGRDGTITSNVQQQKQVNNSNYTNNAGDQENVNDEDWDAIPVRTVVLSRRSASVTNQYTPQPSSPSSRVPDIQRDEEWDAIPVRTLALSRRSASVTNRYTPPRSPRDGCGAFPVRILAAPTQRATSVSNRYSNAPSRTPSLKRASLSPRPSTARPPRLEILPISPVSPSAPHRKLYSPRSPTPIPQPKSPRANLPRVAAMRPLSPLPHLPSRSRPTSPRPTSPLPPTSPSSPQQPSSPLLRRPSSPRSGALIFPNPETISRAAMAEMGTRSAATPRGARLAKRRERAMARTPWDAGRPAAVAWRVSNGSMVTDEWSSSRQDDSEPTTLDLMTAVSPIPDLQPVAPRRRLLPRRGRRRRHSLRRSGTGDDAPVEQPRWPRDLRRVKSDWARLGSFNAS